MENLINRAKKISYPYGKERDGMPKFSIKEKS